MQRLGSRGLRTPMRTEITQPVQGAARPPDSDLYWWYGAGAVFLLGLAGAGLVLAATRPAEGVGPNG